MGEKKEFPLEFMFVFVRYTYLSIAILQKKNINGRGVLHSLLKKSCVWHHIVVQELFPFPVT